MKNNTKVRLHLSKKLFESITKQVLAEGKMTKEALGGYTEVKEPKANKAAEKMTNKMKREGIGDVAKKVGSALGKAKDYYKKELSPAAMRDPNKPGAKLGGPKESLGEEGVDGQVKITLDEYTGSPIEYEIGQWAMKAYPAIAKALTSGNTSGDAGQAIADLGGTIVTLATVGTVMTGIGLGIAKDSIKAAAKKLVSAVKGKGGIKEDEAMGVDPELQKIVGELPQDVKAKIAQH